MIFGYLRVSSADQASDGRTSLADQEMVIRLAAKLQGCDEPQIFSDPGVSGTVPLAERPGAKAMLAAIGSGDTVIAAKLDRMFRSATDALVTVDRLKSQGIAVILMDISSEPVTGNGVGGLFFKIMAAVADFERERIAERVSLGRLGKKQRGGHVGGDPPYGFAVRGRGVMAMLVEDEKEQGIIRDIVEVHAFTGSLSRTAKRLNNNGVRARKGLWTAKQIGRVIAKQPCGTAHA